MTWLDSFDQKWNSPYYGNGRAVSSEKWRAPQDSPSPPWQLYGQVKADVITKFSGIDRFPFPTAMDGLRY